MGAMLGPGRMSWAVLTISACLRFSGVRRPRNGKSNDGCETSRLSTLGQRVEGMDGVGVWYEVTNKLHDQSFSIPEEFC